MSKIVDHVEPKGRDAIRDAGQVATVRSNVSIYTQGCIQVADMYLGKTYRVMSVPRFSRIDLRGECAAPFTMGGLVYTATPDSGTSKSHHRLQI